MSETHLKSPFENVMNFLNVIPQGHEKALKQAFYNAAALFVLITCGAGCWALFYIFEPFVKPLIWALFIGSVLHPFKYSIAKRFESWFEQLSASSTPLCLGFLMVPIHLVNDLSEKIGNALVTYINLLVGLGFGIVMVFVIYTYTPNFCVNIISGLWYINYNVLVLVMENLSIYMFISLIAIYLTILTLFWKDENKQILSASSYVVWFVISLFMARVFGVLQIPLFLFILFTLSFGFAFEVFTVLSVSCEKVSCWNAVKKVLEGTVLYSERGHESKDPIDFEDQTPSLSNDSLCNQGPRGSRSNCDQTNENSEIKRLECDVSHRRPSSIESTEIGESVQGLGFKIPKPHIEEKKVEQSSKYIYAVVWSCVVMMISKNFWILSFLPIPIAIYFIKHIGLYFGVWDLLLSQWSCLVTNTTSWIKIRELALFPPPIQGLFKLTVRLRFKIINEMHNSIDSFASSIVIVGLIFFTFCFSFFLIFQIYAEGLHLLKMGAGVLNFTAMNNPEFLELLPEAWGDKMESVLNDAYVYGREGISKQVQYLLKDVEKAKAAEFEKNVLELWDRICQAWLIGLGEPASIIGPKVNSEAVFSSWNNFLGVFKKMPGLLNVNVMTDFVKENIGTVLSLLESIWVLLKGNLNLLVQFFFATISLVLGGGTVVVNFFINVIVFFSALFYLLSSSGRLYKPVELLSNYCPINGNNLGAAFEAAVNGVFKASFKMALFYGLWTWLIHNLFQVRIVYLPSVLAALLGAIPFLGTYWASLPAVLDLWLAQGKGAQAVILLIFQCLPMSFVDTTIYKEIKGGHPYMTGLAIAGGVFCMGIQGAIFGPVLLCCLLVALNMSSNLMKEPNSDPKEKS